MLPNGHGRCYHSHEHLDRKWGLHTTISAAVQSHALPLWLPIRQGAPGATRGFAQQLKWSKKKRNKGTTHMQDMS